MYLLLKTNMTRHSKGTVLDFSVCSSIKANSAGMERHINHMGFGLNAQLKQQMTSVFCRDQHKLKIKDYKNHFMNSVLP